VRLPDAAAAVRDALAARGLRPAVVGHDAWIASGLETALPETVLLCLQRSDMVDELRRRGVEVFCLAEAVDPATLAGKSSVDLLEHVATREFCQRVGSLAMLAFKPTERLATAASVAGAELVAGDMAVARRFENKLAFVEIARDAGLRTPRWAVHSRAAAVPPFDALAADLGRPLVVQGARGNAGRRTRLCRDQGDLDRALAVEGPGPVRIAGLVEGIPFTATGLAGEPGLLAWIEPCRQITGVDWLTPVALGSCGNVWGDAVVAAGAADALAAGEAIARELGRAGYRGPFGVDFVLAADGPVVIETNPRMVASLPIATQAEVEAGSAPLLLLHLMSWLGLHDIDVQPQPDLAPVSQLIVHQMEGDDSARRPATSGVYSLGPEPRFLRPGCRLSDITGDGEALLLTRSVGEPISPGMEYARVYLRGSEGENTAGAQELVALVREAQW
jgi:hypothetical protein